jgi:hypothetical protein
MKARDVTSAVVSVSPETPTSVIAKILRDERNAGCRWSGCAQLEW